MIIHLTGADTYRSARRLADLRAAFIAKHDSQQLNVVALDGETVHVADIKNAAAANSMFSTKRLVILDRYSPDGSLPMEELIETLTPLSGRNDDLIIILRDTLDNSVRPTRPTRTKTKKPSKKVSTAPFIVPGEKREVFDRLTPAQTSAWISRHVKSQSGTIEPAAVQRLVALCNNDAWRIATELDKVLSFVGSGSVTVADVESMVVSENNSDIFALTDALGQRNAARALTLLRRELASGTNEFSLIATLAGHLRTLYYVKQAQARGSAPSAIASELALHPFVVQKAAGQTGKFSSDELRDFHHRLVTIDHDLKTSPLEAETLLALLMV